MVFYRTKEEAFFEAQIHCHNRYMYIFRCNDLSLGIFERSFKDTMKEKTDSRREKTMLLVIASLQIKIVIIN